MSIPKVTYGGGTPDDILRWLTDGEIHTRGYPLDVIEKPESVDPALPARATMESHNYEVFGFTVATTQQTQNGRGGSALAVGSTGTVRATFMPQRWRIYFYSANAAQILWAAPGGDAEMPSEFCQNMGVNLKSDTLVLPGRGRELSVRSDLANTSALTVIMVAENAVGDLS